MAIYKTAFAAYSVAFSPFQPTKIAVCSSQYFGVVGNGCLQILQIFPPGMNQLYQANTQDGVFDLVWNQANQNQVYVACGDGTVKLFDIAYQQPVVSLQAHTAQVFGVHCNHKMPNQISTASYDRLVKVTDINTGTTISQLPGHQAQVYSAIWHPHKQVLNSPQVLLSCSGDRTVKIWDTRGKALRESVIAHSSGVLSCDWDKYKDWFVTASADQSVCTWVMVIQDSRYLKSPMGFFTGHTLAVRKVKYSPFTSDIIGSASYDMTVRIWNAVQTEPIVHNQHTEFAVGLDFSLFDDKLIASVGWDGRLCVWAYDQPPPVI